MITSEEQYWKEHKIFMDKLKDFRKKRDYGKVITLLNDAENKGLFAKEDIIKWRQRLLKAFQGKL